MFSCFCQLYDLHRSTADIKHDWLTIYSGTWELGTPKGLFKTVLNSEVVLFLRSISMCWIDLGTEVAVLNSQVVPISQVVLKTGTHVHCTCIGDKLICAQCSSDKACRCLQQREAAENYLSLIVYLEECHFCTSPAAEPLSTWTLNLSQHALSPWEPGAGRAAGEKRRRTHQAASTPTKPQKASPSTKGSWALCKLG